VSSSALGGKDNNTSTLGGGAVVFEGLLSLVNERRSGRGETSFPATCVGATRSPRTETDSYLVDPASSHMLVSKIKPCMSKYKQICTVKLRMAH
jgi:hypothetical protein